MSGRKPSKTLKLDLAKARSQGALLTTPDVDNKAIGTPEITRLLMGGTPTSNSKGLRAQIGEEFERASNSAQVISVSQATQLTSMSPSGGQSSQVFLQPTSFGPTGTVYAIVPQSVSSVGNVGGGGGGGFYAAGRGGGGTDEPIDMGFQEVAKLDRKRERNRIAAQRCRQKKMDKIGQLESEVDNLKKENFGLEQHKKDLEDFISNLQTELKEHKIKYGCVLNIPDI